MTRLVDDQRIFENSRDLLRSDIRGFEQLCQDLSDHNTRANLELKSHMRDRLSEMEADLDRLKESHREQRVIIETQRKSFQTLQSQTAWNKYQMDDMKKVTDDLHVTVNKCQDLEVYLHKVLPINVETQIFKACTVACHDSKGRTRLANYTSATVNRLLQMKQDRGSKFDKDEVFLPELKTINKHLMFEPVIEEEKEGELPGTLEDPSLRTEEAKQAPIAEDLGTA